MDDVVTRSRGFLRLDTQPGSDLLVDPDGHPVWPVRSQEELVDIECTAKVMGGRLKRLTGIAGNAVIGREEVVSFDAEAHDAARLYAHLTGRRHRAMDSMAGLRHSRFTSVIVTTVDRLTAGFMEVLYQRGRSAVGIVAADSADALRRQVLVRAAAAALPACGKRPGSVAINPTVDMGRWASRKDEILGGLVAPDAIRRAMARGSPVLTLATHGDGMDADLESLVLCRISKPPGQADPARVPGCLVSGYCHRLRRPLPQALISKEIMSPDDVSARVFIFAPCFGILVKDAAVDPRWTLGMRLAGNPNIGALLTTWELSFAEPRAFDVLVRDLRAGFSLGHAVARFNRTDAGRNCRLCLFGDPRVSVAHPDPAAPVATVARSRRRFSPVDTPPTIGRGDGGVALSFFRSYLDNAILEYSAEDTGGPLRKMDPSLSSAYRALGALKRFAASSHPSDSDSRAETMRRAILHQMFCRGLTLNNWLRNVVESVIDWKSCKCWACGGPARTAIVTLSLDSADRRRLLACARCNLVEDVQAGATIRFKLNARDMSLRITGRLPRKHWNAALQLRSPTPDYRRTWEWPTAPDGRPAKAWRCPDAVPPGPIRVAFVLVQNYTFNCISTEVHRGLEQR